MPGRTVNGLGPTEPSRKRSRRDTEEHDVQDAHVVQVDQASSSLRHGSKRVRLSEAGPRKRVERDDMSETPSSASDNDADMEDPNDDDDDEDPPPPQTQYEELRDDGFKHLLYEEQDDHRATQKLQSRSAVLGENRVADNGILESITCINFMCHSRLHCDLGPLLNFIVGENGSGKSAILTAITLCLGGKASSTNRGASLKSFVKEGQDHTILTVKIKNQGIDAYRHDIYGDSIVVERHFSRAGSSGFKVKSATGRSISSKKSEVEEIVEYYCLQVDNPLNILSQDNARQFLNAASASLKYKFFIQGVQLEQLDKDYELVKEFLDANEQKLPEQEERAQAAKGQFDAAEKLLKAIQDNHAIRREKRLCTNKLVWAQVVAQETELQDRENALLEAEATIAQAEQTKIQLTQVFDEKTHRLEQAQNALETVKDDLPHYQARLDKAAEEFASAKKDLAALHRDERDVFVRYKEAGERVNDLNNSIAEERRRLEDTNGDVHKQTQDQLDQAREKVASLTRQRDEAEARLPGLQGQEVAAKAQVEKANQASGSKRREMQATETQIESLQKSRGSPMDAYEPAVSSLLKMINNESRFAEKPIGPIGLHVRVLQPVWSPILEKTLGGILNGFIVTSKRDHQRLQEMMGRLKIQNCPILIANRRPINTSGREPDKDFDTILRILKFDDELVKNQLIINNSIEQVVLIQSRKKAEEVMFNGPAPQNVVACLCLHDGKRGEGLRLTNKGGNIGTTPVIPGNQKPRMQSDVDSQIAVQNDILEQHRGDWRQLEGEKRLAQQASQHCLAEIKSNKKEVDKLVREVRLAQTAIVQIEEELDKFDGADGRLQGLQQELELANSQRDQYGDQYGDMKVKKEQQSKNSEILKEKLDTEKLNMRDYEAKQDKVRDKATKAEQVRHLALVQKNAAFEEADKCRDDKRIAEGKRDRQFERVKQFTTQAKQVSPERVFIAPGETTASVEQKLNALDKQLETRRKRVGMSDEQVNLRVLETKKSFETAEEVWVGTKEQINVMKQTLLTRLTKWRYFQRFISASSRTNFLYLLSERGFRGKLLIDHKNKKLQVQVEPDETRKKATGRDTKTLSGGEKSFSSICLLLAVWEAMGSPLRCLDEFDVFMDNVNRAISTDMLITAARRSVGRQYILITPNAIQGKNALDKDVKIIRLTDPRQRTLID